MKYEKIRPGTFLDRPNRFVAHVELGGTAAVCHVKNTGRCRELLVPGAKVYLEESGNPARKTQYDLIAVEKGTRLINMDAQAPNRVFGAFAASGALRPDLEYIRPEFTYGDSRFDFRLECHGAVQFVEVKGVTLLRDGRALFPDAPTERGIKHLRGLMRAVQEGYEAAAVFVIQMKQAQALSPNDETQSAFGQALREAARAGVALYAYDCQVTLDHLSIDAPVPIEL